MTENAHLALVRSAVQSAKPETFTPSPVALDHLIGIATLQRAELRETFSFVQGNPLLTLHVERAGKAVSDLLLTLGRMRANAGETAPIARAS